MSKENQACVINPEQLNDILIISDKMIDFLKDNSPHTGYAFHACIITLLGISRANNLSIDFTKDTLEAWSKIIYAK